MNTNDVWVDIPEYKGIYQINKEGQIKSLSRPLWNGFKFWISKERILKQSLDQKGYYKITLCNKNGHKTHRIHQLLGKCFLENKENKPVVNHINGVKTDNRLCNLEWTTFKENNQHAQDTGLNKSRYSEKQKAAARKSLSKTYSHLKHKEVVYG